MPTIEERALALVNEVKGCEKWKTVKVSDLVPAEALFASLEAHDATLAEFEAFKREVSDSVEHYLDQWRYSIPSREVFAGQFGSFILPKPVDPLVEAVKDCGYATLDAIEKEFADDLRAALAARGLKLVEVGDAD